MLATVCAPDQGEFVARILNDCWMVRHYVRGRRTNGLACARRQQAILKLGLTAREAFNHCNDFESILRALIEGLHPQDDPPF